MISVIVIGKNEGSRLEQCFLHVRQALCTLSHELIYVDSRSTDNSVEIAKAHGARCYLLEEEHTTAGLGRYVGTQEARGEYLLFLDGDMQLQPGFVERAMMRMEEAGYSGACGIREDHYMRNGAVVSVNPNYFGCERERIALEFGGAIFLKAEALRAYGGWSPDTVACEEAELHARLNAHGCRIVELPIPMIVHCDAVRDDRSVLRVFFSRRRLGEGQAMRCAMAGGSAGAYIRREKEKFTCYALDWLCVLLLAALGGYGFAASCFVQAMQLGFFLARRRPRTFVSTKLFFFAFPAGLLTYRRHSRAYAEIQ